MLIHSDWHIHSEFSYDAVLPLKEIAETAAGFGFCKVGITDHVNYNDNKFLEDLKRSACHVKEAQKAYPNMVLGVELTPIEKPKFDYIAKTGTRDGYVAPVTDTPFPIELPVTKDELTALGVRYGIGASHWRVDGMGPSNDQNRLKILINEWYRQQLWLACDKRVTVLGHPWYSSSGIWYKDFSVIPRAMNAEIAAALKENGKYVECNTSMFRSAKTSEKFRYQYAEFLREFFEAGIPVTHGSDAHTNYTARYLDAEKYLLAAGFTDGDISEIAEKDLW